MSKMANVELGPTGGTTRRFPAFYAIRFAGSFAPYLSAAFEGMAIERQGELTMVSGVVVDQAHLQGLIHQLTVLGLDLVDVRRLDRSET